MGNTCATSLTTLAMLDALEAGISALQSQCVSGPGGVALQAELHAAGISTGEFARLVYVPQDAVEGWASGAKAAPAWAAAAIRLVALLTPSARHKLLYGAMRTHSPVVGQTQSHPFSRIEEL